MTSTETAAKGGAAWNVLGGRGGRRSTTSTVRLAPDPEPRERIWPIFSVDDHVIEPPHMFEGRIPARFAEVAPRIVEEDDGSQVWRIADRTMKTIGLSAVAGRADDDWSTDPTRFDEMRPGCWNPRERIRDMDIAGIVASVCFPSALPGFAGRAFTTMKDPDFAMALVRAWNDWMIDEWVAEAPDRFVGIQLPCLLDPHVAGEEIRRNAERGFKAVTFTENPVMQRLPSLHTEHWDPFFAACAETGTVVCLHSGSSGWTPVVAQDAPVSLYTTTFMLNAMASAAEWVWSGVPARFPDLRVALSEGGLSWVPALVERLDYVTDHSLKATKHDWPYELRPAEVLLRNFWFCGIHDPAGIALRDRIGVDHMMLETDYPHGDSTWPDCQSVIEDLVADIPVDDAAALCFRTAAELFRHDPGIVPGEWAGLAGR